MRGADRLRPVAGDLALRVAQRLNRRRYVEVTPHRPHQLALDYPTAARNEPRWGYGRPPHGRLAEIIGRHRDAYGDALRMLAGYHDDLLAIGRLPGDPTEPHWLSAWLLGLDGVSLYGLIRDRAPARYVEVGSGNSTRFVARARRDGGLATHITSIDPHPRVEVDAICDRILRAPLEEIDPSVFGDLRAGDMLFVDNSHRVFMNSDVVTFFLEILPALRPGVLVGIHDILWPDDYLPEWAEYYFSEQYLFGALLLGEPAWIEPLLACNFAAADPELRTILEPLWRAPGMQDVDPRGFCFWMTIAERSRR